MVSMFDSRGRGRRSRSRRRFPSYDTKYTPNRRPKSQNIMKPEKISQGLGMPAITERNVVGLKWERSKRPQLLTVITSERSELQQENCWRSVSLVRGTRG